MSSLASFPTPSPSFQGQAQMGLPSICSDLCLFSCPQPRLLPQVSSCHCPASLLHLLLPTCTQLGGLDGRAVEPWTFSPGRAVTVLG